jgi:Mrp family chromosome partitioning ATPase
VPSSELLVVTTPQVAATEIAERAGTIAVQTRQNVVGVVENMAWLSCPHCGERAEVFGDGWRRRRRRNGSPACSATSSAARPGTDGYAVA